MPTIEGYPLSLQQKRCWKLLSEVNALELRSNLEVAIEGELDIPVFEEAIRLVLRRHEIFRCVIADVSGAAEPLQMLVDGGDDDRAEGKSIGVQWELKDELSGSHTLFVSFPATAVDNTSLEIFIGELAKTYDLRISGGTDLSEPMQYLDYAQWQVDLQSSVEARTGQHYWNRLELPQTLLPLEKQSSSFRGAGQIQSLDEAIKEGIERCAVAHAVDKEIVLATAWAGFVSRLSETGDRAIVGLHSPGRTFEELQGALGLYDRYIPLGFDISTGSTPSALMKTMSRAFTEGKEKQEFFGKGEQNAEPLAFLFEFWKPISGIAGGKALFRMRHSECHTEPFKLKLAYQDAELPELRLFYDAARTSAEYSAILLKRFKTFLSEFIARPDVSIFELKNISAWEWELVTKEFPRSPAAKPVEPTVIHQFMKEVAQHPQRPAVICGGRMLSYRELNARANQLARQLVKLGVGRGEPVAISAERSTEMIVGLLGIQKAGGAYVPLDPAYPRSRLSFILKDCGARVLVAQPHLVERLPAHQCTLVPLVGDVMEPEDDHSLEPVVDLRPEEAAYIIYTSGSTGQPKGVQISHSNLAHSTAARIQYYKEPIANYLLLSSFAFDSSIAGIFWALTQGGTLTIPREGMHQDPQELARLICAYKVSHLLALPSFYQAILQQVRNGELTSLRTVIVAGEACTPQLVQRHYSILPDTTLFNEYGPTEGTVWATVHRCQPEDATGGVPIGHPVPNMWLYILDDQRKAVGIGELGEIYIGGPTVACGYMNREDLTQQKFVENPFFDGGASIPVPQKLYRTGDLGRFRVDGLVDFHGRIDEQVKIRGHRIEIGEIESVLAECPGVVEAAVVAGGDAHGEKRLIAYVVPREESHLSLPDVRSYAHAKLPAFMIPSQFVAVPDLPLTPNGKVDRKALPAPDEIEQERRALVAPRTSEEAKLAIIWAEVLKLEAVGLGQNFFDLGGHSLLAIQVIARVRDAFKVEFPMAAFFESPTIEGMATALAQCREQKETGGRIRRATRVVASESLLAQLGTGSSV